MPDRFQPERYERKYLISNQQALKVREFIKNYLEPDEYSARQPNYSYPIHSIYLDSNVLTTYWAFVHAEKNRFKLRLRFYDNNPDSPVFFELKMREGDCIVKHRAPVRKEAAAMLVAGHFPGPEHLLDPTPKKLVAAQKFCRRMQDLQAQPKLHVAYQREAWLPRDNNFLRVTMDRNLRGAIDRHGRLNTELMEPFRAHPLYLPYGDDTVILELKYTHFFPEWYRDLVQFFNLIQGGAPKYGSLVMGIGEERVSAPAEWNPALSRSTQRKQI